MYPLWIKIPAFILAFLIFGRIAFYGIEKMSGVSNKTSWLGALIVTLSGLACFSFIEAFEEKRVVAAFAEGFVAYTLVYGIPIACAIVGYYSGRKAYRITEKQWIGWITGILIALIIFIPLHAISSNIPGVGWRMGNILKDSNTVDCDY